MNPKNMYQNSFFNAKPAKILFFKTDINEQDPDNAYLYMARTAHKIGNDVHIFTSNCERSVLTTELRDITVHKVGRFIPKQIFGWGRMVMHFLRTLYMFFWLLVMKKDLKPTFVIIHNSIGLLILLKLIGRFTVVLMYTFDEDELLEAAIKGVIKKRNFIHNFFMRMANEIVVLNKLSRTVFANAFYLKDKYPTLLYPCLIGSVFHESLEIPMGNIIKVRDDDMLLVCFGPMRASSNFELCIEAFSILLNNARILNSYIYYNTYLVIASQYQPSKESDEYYYKLEHLSQTLCSYRPAVAFLPELPIDHRKTLMSKCDAVLVPMVCLNARTILEAGVLNKPVIATNCGIAGELIKEGTSGFLSQPDPLEFARCMTAIVYNRHLHYDISQQIFKFFQQNFGLMKYSKDFKGIVVRNSHN